MKLFLSLIEHHVMKPYVGVEVQLYSLTSAIVADVWSASRSGHFSTVEGALGTFCIRGWIEVEVQLHLCVTSALVGDEWSASRTGGFTLVEGALDAYCIRGWIEPRAGLNSPLATSFTLVSCVAYSSILKIEATCSSETSVVFQRTTRRYIPEVKTLL
jgi:hypothetical protein